MLEITTRIGCSNACLYCPQDELLSAYSKRSNVFLMSLDTFKKCMDKIPLNERILFCGMGQPWLNPECTKMVLYAHQLRRKVEVDTTLVGMDLSDIDLLEDIPFTEFNIHLPSDEGLERIEVDENYLKY